MHTKKLSHVKRSSTQLSQALSLSLIHTHTCPHVLQGSQVKLLILVYEAGKLYPKIMMLFLIQLKNALQLSTVKKKKEKKQFVVLGSVIQALLQSVI